MANTALWFTVFALKYNKINYMMISSEMQNLSSALSFGKLAPPDVLNIVAGCAQTAVWLIGNTDAGALPIGIDDHLQFSG